MTHEHSIFTIKDPSEDYDYDNYEYFEENMLEILGNS